jgi:hypothetical protein
MLIHISGVRSGGELLAHSTVLMLRGERHRGLKPLPGVNVVAGLTGSGKTLLAEALWLGVAHALSALLDDERFHNAPALAVRAYGIRPIDMKAEICLSDVEVPGLRREACIEAEISEGLESWVAVPEEAAGNDELRKSLVYALLHVISVPDRVKWRAAHALRELHRSGLLKLAAEEDIPRELCLAAAALVPPVDAGRAYSPCYMRVLGIQERRELELESERVGGEPYFNTAASHGELSRALFEAAYEFAAKLSKLAREEHGVSAVPIVYVDDAFEGLDAAKIRSLLSRDYDASIYAATHRLEAGAYSARNLLLTYGTKASQLVEQPRDFRFALVDEELVEEDEEIFEDVSSKLVGRT